MDSTRPVDRILRILSLLLIGGLLLWTPVAGPGAETVDPVAALPEVLRDLGRLTGWLFTGLQPPTVVMVDPATLDRLHARRHGAMYEGETNTIYLGNTCLQQARPEWECRALLLHALVHWVQFHTTNWPGTPAERELEAQAWERAYRGEQLFPGRPWMPAGPRPLLTSAVLALLPPEARPYVHPVAVWQMEIFHEHRLEDGYFQDTEGRLVGMWVYHLQAMDAEHRYTADLVFHQGKPVAVAVQRDDGQVLGWWWDRGYRPDAAGRLPAASRWTGEWVRTR